MAAGGITPAALRLPDSPIASRSHRRKPCGRQSVKPAYFCLKGKNQTRSTTENGNALRNFTATLIHSCCSKKQQPALGQISISRLGQYSISADTVERFHAFVELFAFVFSR
jgi:hypothetical protein